MYIYIDVIYVLPPSLRLQPMSPMALWLHFCTHHWSNLCKITIIRSGVSVNFEAATEDLTDPSPDPPISKTVSVLSFKGSLKNFVILVLSEQLSMHFRIFTP